MQFQDFVNIGAGAGLAVLGWFARELWDAVSKLKEDIKDLEIKVADEYSKKVDINARFDKLDNLLERIFDKIDKKADK